MTLIEKVKKSLSLIVELEGFYSVPEGHIEMLFENDPEIEQIKGKCKMVTDMMTGLSKEEMEKFMEKDFETEIWQMIIVREYLTQHLSLSVSSSPESDFGRTYDVVEVKLFIDSTEISSSSFTINDK